MRFFKYTRTHILAHTKRISLRCAEKTEMAKQLSGDTGVVLEIRGGRGERKDDKQEGKED